MKRASVFFVCLVVFVTGLFVFMAKDQILSYFLSQQFNLSIRIRGVRVVKLNQIEFLDLVIRKTAETPPWIHALRGKIFLKEVWRPLADLQVSLEKLGIGEGLMPNSSVMGKWFEHAGPLFRRFDALDVRISRVMMGGDNYHIRILKAAGPDFRLAGNAWVRSGKLGKLNTRLYVSPEISSQWSSAILKKMSINQNGWRSVGLSYGGQTWMLRGIYGPLLQFSGNLQSK